MNDNFKNIIGYDDIKLELNRIIDELNNKEKYQKLGVKIEKGLIILGRPYAGKSTLAMDMIDSLQNRNKYILRKTVDGKKFLEEINNIFIEAANNEPSVILFDDMDKFSNNDRRHRNPSELIAIQSNIDKYYDKDIFVIATVNSIRTVPISLTRPLRLKLLLISKPNLKDSKKIIAYHMNKRKYDNNVDIDKISKMFVGCSCAEIEYIINLAGIYAGYENKELITENNLIKAFLKTKCDVSEVIDYSDKALEKICVHECGKLVSMEALEPKSVNLVTFRDTGNGPCGITLFNDDYDDFEHLENKVISLLSGKAAYELYYGMEDVYCNKELENAFEIVESFTEEYCFYGFDKLEKENGSDVYNNRKENCVHENIIKYYEKAKRILIENKDVFLKSINMLKEKRYLCYEDIRTIYNQNDISFLNE